VRGTSAGVFLNRVGDTLLTGAAVGESGATPDVFETASTTLDFRVSQRVARIRGSDISVALKAANLFRSEDETVWRLPILAEGADGTGGTDGIARYEDIVRSLHDNSVRISLGASWKW